MCACSSCQRAIGKPTYKPATRAGQDHFCSEGVCHAFCSRYCLVAAGGAYDSCRVCAETLPITDPPNDEAVAWPVECETCHETFDEWSDEWSFHGCQRVLECSAGKFHVFCGDECATVDGMCQVCHEYTKPKKPSWFTELTQEEWDEFWELEERFVASGVRYSNGWYQGGAVLDYDKKKNPFVWVKWRGRMMKVAWSFGAYQARHYPRSKVARDYLETLELSPFG